MFCCMCGKSGGSLPSPMSLPAWISARPTVRVAPLGSTTASVAVPMPRCGPSSTTIVPPARLIPTIEPVIFAPTEIRWVALSTLTTSIWRVSKSFRTRLIRSSPQARAETYPDGSLVSARRITSLGSTSRSFGLRRPIQIARLSVRPRTGPRAPGTTASSGPSSFAGDSAARGTATEGARDEAEATAASAARTASAASALLFIRLLYTGDARVVPANLLHRDRLGQVTRLVHVQPTQARDSVGEQLQRQRGQDGLEKGGRSRDEDDVVRVMLDVLVAVGRDRDHVGAAGADFLDVRDDLVVHVRGRRDADDGRFFVEQRDRPVLHFPGRIRLGRDVGDLLQLQRSLECDREADVPAEIEEERPVVEAVGDLLDRMLTLEEGRHLRR